MVYYKYKEWNKYTRQALELNKLWFSKPAKFNDPYDCQIRVSRDDVNEGLAIEFLNHVYSKSKSDRVMFFKNIFKHFDRHRGDLEEVCQFLRDRISDFENYFSCLGILSLSADPKSMLMWGHYGGLHKGIAIGIKEDEDSALADPKVSGFVEYTNDYPKIDAKDIVLGSIEDWRFYSELIINTKSREWSYEHEKRVVISEGNQLFEPPGKITEIIFGARCENETIDEVVKACQNLDVNFRRAVLKSKSFNIVIVDDPSLN